MPLPPITAIPAARVTVRAIRSADLDDLFEINGDDAVTRFLPYKSWQTPADGSAWLTRMEALAAGGTAQQLVIERNADRKVIGTTLLFTFDEGSARLALGYALGRKHWRQGYAHEAIHAVCGHAFREMGIRRIEAEVDPRNAGSNALLLRLGFVREGMFRQRWITKGAPTDTNIYGCLAQEWLPQQEASMQSDEQQIRQLVSTWMDATRVGDVDQVLSLMTEDAVFLVPGQPPMRKADFAAAMRSRSGAQAPQVDGSSEIQELQVHGDWAFMWTKLSVVITPPGGASPLTRAGHTLTVLRKQDGKWLLARDANLLAPTGKP